SGMPNGVSLGEVIQQCADAAGWEAGIQGKPHVTSFASLPSRAASVRVGRGFACAYKNVGFSFGFPERCEATIELFGKREIDRVVLHHGGADVGQGAHTAFRQMAAEATGVPLEKVEIIASDTATSGDSGSASASRLTFMAGNSIRQAADAALAKWQDEERPAVGYARYVPPPTEALDYETGIGDPNFSYGYVAEYVEVAVDVETGHLEVQRVVCADDVGKVVNPQLVVGQIEGAIVQAYGYSVTENLRQENGRILNPRLSTYLIPGIRDIPHRVDSVIVEVPDPLGPWGARGMAEMPFIPLAPAIAAAIHDATGVWLDKIPFTPGWVSESLQGVA
ncbi:MAG: molybdopterin-dependent oxidoreductase, partial [Anaerolineales bacterium]|nr:molybdopterin-dependent oxidoreductase [Anaerolineales bacterium]